MNKINTNEILQSHKLALCHNHSICIIPIPPAEPPETNAFTTITILTFLQTQDEEDSDTNTQPMYRITLVNLNTNNSPQNHNVHPHNQSTVIIQQFSMITQVLRNFTDKVSGNINKIIQACPAAQENTGKLKEKVLTTPQDIPPPNPATGSSTFEAYCASNSSYETNGTTSLQTNNFGITQYPNNEAHHSQRPYEIPVSPHTYVGQQPANLTHLILINL